MAGVANGVVTETAGGPVMTTMGWQIKAAIVTALRRVRRGASCRISSAQISRNIFLIGLGFLLSACAGGSPVTPEAEPRVEGNQKTDEVTPEVFSKEAFRTDGKPTKTIETPLGPREVYDPIADKEVRTAFKRIYEDGTKLVRRDRLGDKSSDESTVFYARDAYYKSIISEGCNILLSADCSTIYYFKPLIKYNGQPSGNYEECLNSKQGNCRWKNITTRIITPSSHCGFRGNAWHSHESTYSCPISLNVKSVGCNAAPEKTRSIDESLDWFFEHDCRGWEASK